jgi:hypothetical protein
MILNCDIGLSIVLSTFGSSAGAVAVFASSP